jgi:hypothetical protein
MSFYVASSLSSFLSVFIFLSVLFLSILVPFSFDVTEFSFYPSLCRVTVCSYCILIGLNCVVFSARNVYLVLLRCLQLGPHVITIFPTDVVRQAQSPLSSFEDMFHCDSGFNSVLLSPRAAVVSDRITAFAVTRIYSGHKQMCHFALLIYRVGNNELEKPVEGTGLGLLFGGTEEKKTRS